MAVLATFVPALRAARTSTVSALNDQARAPRRGTWVIAISAHLPASLLLGLRLVARRPRRVLLAAVSIAITVSGVVAVLFVHADFDQAFASASGVPNPETSKLSQVMLVLTIALALLAAVNACVITWATVLDTRRSSALARALGASPRQISTGLSASQLLPAFAGGLLGIPGGYELYAAVKNGGGVYTPPLWWLVATVIGTLAAVALLAAVPARIGARRPPAPILQSEQA